MLPPAPWTPEQRPAQAWPQEGSEAADAPQPNEASSVAAEPAAVPSQLPQQMLGPPLQLQLRPQGAVHARGRGGQQRPLSAASAASSSVRRQNAVGKRSMTLLSRPAPMASMAACFQGGSGGVKAGRPCCSGAMGTVTMTASAAGLPSRPPPPPRCQAAHLVSNDAPGGHAHGPRGGPVGAGPLRGRQRASVGLLLAPLQHAAHERVVAGGDEVVALQCRGGRGR